MCVAYERVVLENGACFRVRRAVRVPKTESKSRVAYTTINTCFIPLTRSREPQDAACAGGGGGKMGLPSDLQAVTLTWNEGLCHLDVVCSS